MAIAERAQQISALERYLRRRGWTLDRALDRARVYRLPAAGHRLLVADPDTRDAAFHLDRACELLARWEHRPRALVEADIDGARRRGRLEIFFDGGPVADGQIELTFAAKMLGDVRKLIAALHSAHTRSEPLSNLGTLTTPRRVMLASTPVGSFGFELVEDIDEPQALLPIGDGARTGIGAAMDELVGLFAGAHSDDDLGRLLVEQDPRVLRNLDQMLRHIRSAGASVRLVGPTQTIRLSGDDVGRARERLAEGEKSVREVQCEGRLEGVLPHDRTFELLVEAVVTDGAAEPWTPRLLRGSVARSVEDAQVRAWSAWAQSEVRATIREVQTIRPGREPKVSRALLAVWRPGEASPSIDEPPVDEAP